MATELENKVRLIETAERQGWSDLSLITILLGFIEERNLLGELADTFEDIADEENTSGAEGFFAAATEN